MFAIKTDGTMFSWGSNASGQLGLGTVLPASSPVQVLGGPNWKQVANNDRTVIALKKDGSLWSWGYGQNGAGGINGPDSYRSTPTQIGRSYDWKFLASTRGLSSAKYAIKTDGTLWVWGYLLGLSIMFPTPTSQIVSSPAQVTGRNDWKWVGPAHQYGFVGITDDSLDGF
jgi:alpha-tubulin suppressor-like RCC1 family protein